MAGYARVKYRISAIPNSDFFDAYPMMIVGEANRFWWGWAGLNEIFSENRYRWRSLPEVIS